MSASLQSLGDSGISDQENNGASGGGPLSNLPGPGKFKEMTKSFMNCFFYATVKNCCRIMV
jgi:hypothetical protein